MPSGPCVGLAPLFQDDRKWAEEIVRGLFSDYPPWAENEEEANGMGLYTRAGWLAGVLRNCREDERSRIAKARSLTTCDRASFKPFSKYRK